MNLQLFANNAISQLVNPIGTTDTQLLLTPGTGSLFPSITNPTTQYFLVTLQSGNNYEIVKVIYNSNDSFTVVRGQENTLPQSFPAGTTVELRITAGTLANLQTEYINQILSSGVVSNLIINGNCTFGVLQGQSTSTLNNTLDDGNGNATFNGNVQLGTSSGNVIKTYLNTLDDGSGNIIVSGTLSINNSYTINGTTSGTITYTQPNSGTYKKVVLYANNYENNSTTSQTITFHIPFVNNPVITFNNTGMSLTINTTTLTLPNSMSSSVNGLIIVEGI